MMNAEPLPPFENEDEIAQALRRFENLQALILRFAQPTEQGRPTASYGGYYQTPPTAWRLGDVCFAVYQPASAKYSASLWAATKDPSDLEMQSRILPSTYVTRRHIEGVDQPDDRKAQNRARAYAHLSLLEDLVRTVWIKEV